MSSQPFSNLIGQEHIKKSLSFYIEAAKKGGAMPPILFTGARGFGKTVFARRVAKELKKPLLEINSSTIKNNSAFFEQVFIPAIMGNEVVVLLDEFHNCPKDLQQAFLTVFNTEKATRTHFEWQGSSMEFDFTKQTFLFATTEPDKIFHALKDRLEEIDFRPYSNNELGSILKLHADFVEFAPEVMEKIILTLRGNARAAVKRAKQIIQYCEAHNTIKFGAIQWKSLCDSLGIHSQGLTNSEVQVLEILNTRGSCSLAMLSAVTGLSRTALQRDVEMNLLKKGYMRINGLREITGAGRNAITNYENQTA